MATKLEQKGQALYQKRAELEKFFTDHKGDDGYTFNADQLVEVKNRNDELETLAREYEADRNVEEIQAKNLAAMGGLDNPTRPGGVPFRGSLIDTKGMGTDGASLIERPNLGKVFTGSKEFKGRRPGQQWGFNAPEVEVKALFATTAGWDPFVSRLPRVALSPQQQPKIAEAFPTGTTNQHAIKYMLETVYTNAAAESAEGGAYNEATLTLAEQLQAVVKLTVFLPITDEQLDDEEQAADYVNNRLDLMLRQRLDTQLINGDGAGANLRGLKNVANIVTRAKAAGDSVIDTILKGMTDVQTVGFSEPSSVFLNPLDWMAIRLLRTADGLYIWGHPSQAGPATIWGLPVVSSTYVAQGEGYVGDFAAQTMLFFRRGVEFLVSNSHNDFFAKGQQAVRADMRACLVVFRPKAIARLTGF